MNPAYSAQGAPQAVSCLPKCGFDAQPLTVDFLTTPGSIMLYSQDAVQLKKDKAARAAQAKAAQYSPVATDDAAGLELKSRENNKV